MRSRKHPLPPAFCPGGEDVVDSWFRMASFTLRIPAEDAVELTPFIGEVVF